MSFLKAATRADSLTTTLFGLITCLLYVCYTNCDADDQIADAQVTCLFGNSRANADDAGDYAARDCKGNIKVSVINDCAQ